MTEDQRMWLKSIRSQSVFANSPLDNLPKNVGCGIVIEYFGVMEWSRSGVAILLEDSRAQYFSMKRQMVPPAFQEIFKNEPNRLADSLAYRETTQSQVTVAYPHKLAKRQFQKLTALGLWELNDFCPSSEILDGEYLIVRACDKKKQVEVDVTLFCLGESVLPTNRKLEKYLMRLMSYLPK